MSTIHTILCPVDFTSHSDRALAYGVSLAEQLGAKIELVHVFQVPIYAAPDGAMLTGPELLHSISDQLEKALHDLAAAEAGGARTHLLEGVPASEITRLAAELPAQLIVMGTHGRTGLKHLLIGSVAERVVRTSEVPVLTVPLEKD